MHGENFRGVVQLGDFVDFWQLSRFDKDPARKRSIKDDLDLYAAQIDVWEQMLPEGSQWIQLEGNHEDRLRRYIWQKAPDIAEIVPSIPQVLRFQERTQAGRVEFLWHEIKKWNSCHIGDVQLHHGHYFNKHVAVGNLDRYRYKMITGHTHRVQYACNDEYWHCSLGHGSDEDQTGHVPAPTPHHQALGVLTTHDGKGSLEVILAKSGKASFRGLLLDANAS